MTRDPYQFHLREVDIVEHPSFDNPDVLAWHLVASLPFTVEHNTAIEESVEYGGQHSVPTFTTPLETKVKVTLRGTVIEVTKEAEGC